MALTDADKTFIAATISMDRERDREAIYAAYRKAHGAAAVGLTNKQIGHRIARLPKDAVAEVKDRLSAVAEHARGQAVAAWNAELFNEQATLSRIRQKVLQGIETVLDMPIGEGISVHAKHEWAELGHKVTVAAKPGASIDPRVMRDVVERRKRLEAERDRMLRSGQAKDAGVAASTAAPAMRPEQGGQIGRA